ncbi:MAG: hypothetical protein MJ148_01300 [Clostridia bacterium]|nr:hypothetical protein [Clostridia bacterium]
MKQLIVLVATIILGIGIGGIVLGFDTTATDLGTSATTGLGYLQDKMDEIVETYEPAETIPQDH